MIKKFFCAQPVTCGTREMIEIPNIHDEETICPRAVLLDGAKLSSADAGHAFQVMQVHSNFVPEWCLMRDVIQTYQFIVPWVCMVNWYRLLS